MSPALCIWCSLREGLCRCGEAWAARCAEKLRYVTLLVDVSRHVACSQTSLPLGSTKRQISLNPNAAVRWGRRSGDSTGVRSGACGGGGAWARTPARTGHDSGARGGSGRGDSPPRAGPRPSLRPSRHRASSTPSQRRPHTSRHGHAQPGSNRSRTRSPYSVRSQQPQLRIN